MPDYTCPICATNYAPVPIRGFNNVRAGSLCGDLSQEQTRNCVGRLIRTEDLARAEWRFPYPEDPRPKAILHELEHSPRSGVAIVSASRAVLHTSN